MTKKTSTPAKPPAAAPGAPAWASTTDAMATARSPSTSGRKGVMRPRLAPRRALVITPRRELGHPCVTRATSASQRARTASIPYVAALRAAASPSRRRSSSDSISAHSACASAATSPALDEQPVGAVLDHLARPGGASRSSPPPMPFAIASSNASGSPSIARAEREDRRRLELRLHVAHAPGELHPVLEPQLGDGLALRACPARAVAADPQPPGGVRLRHLPRRAGRSAARTPRPGPAVPRPHHDRPVEPRAAAALG